MMWSANRDYTELCQYYYYYYYYIVCMIRSVFLRYMKYVIVYRCFAFSTLAACFAYRKIHCDISKYVWTQFTLVLVHIYVFSGVVLLRFVITHVPPRITRTIIKRLRHVYLRVWNEPQARLTFWCQKWDTSFGQVARATRKICDVVHCFLVIPSWNWLRTK